MRMGDARRARRRTFPARRRPLTLIALVLAAPAIAKAPDFPTGAKAADVLVWSQAERQARFPHMERLFPHETVKAGGQIHPLPAGRPLALKLVRDGAPESLESWMAADNSAGLLILQDGKIRLERYGAGAGPADHWASFSVTKSVTSTLYAAAIRDGYIKSLDDKVTTYLPEMKDSAYQDVSLRQLLTMSSGVRWSEDYTNPQSDVARMYDIPPDPGLDPIVSYMRHLPREAPAGTKWNYKTGETDLAGIVLVRATGQSLATYLARKIWRPFGMARDAVWMVNAQRNSPGGCCLSATLRDLGRFGEFIRGGGMADGKPVLPADWLPKATSEQIATGRPGLGYGYFWWIGPDATFDARGIFGQGIHIDPKRRLVVVVLAAWPAVFDPPHAAGREQLMAAIEAAVDAEGTAK